MTTRTGVNVALFRRPKDENESEWVPTDDAADFSLTERQKQIRRIAENRKHVEKLWAQIEERWRHPWRQE
jgi:hypothetical protein